MLDIQVAWPSGLRRWFKAPVSSEAWVRIPPLPDKLLTSCYISLELKVVSYYSGSGFIGGRLSTSVLLLVWDVSSINRKAQSLSTT